MSLLYIPYIILTSMLFIALLPAFLLYCRMTRREDGNFMERLGLIPADTIQNLSGGCRIWVHAASLGEVKVAASIINALSDAIPDCSIIMSTMTESGRHLAEEIFEKDVLVIYAPVDFVGSVRMSLSSVRPDIMVFLETEIWPIWLCQARRMGIKIVLINGRISPRSFKRYFSLRLLFREVLKNFDAFSMIMRNDADRIKAMGADPGKIEINGNAKYDLLKSNADPGVEAEYRRLMNLSADDRVFIAGSTRNGEEEMLLDAYERILKEFPDTILVIVPRHIDRTSEIGSLLERHGFQYQLRSDLDKEKRSAGIVIVNTFGELFNIYSIGTIIFCGGSLVPLGGQNPLEPAVWGKVVFYGPYMENFPDARKVLEAADAGILVGDAKALADRAIWFLSHPVDLDRLGKRAGQAVVGQGGAAKKHAEVIKRVLG